MALLEDLIKDIADTRLRNQIAGELSKLKARKKFGLVFEQHLPEIVQLPGLAIKPGARVAKRADKAAGFFVVTAAVNGKKVSIVPERGGAEQITAKDDLVVVKRFGEPIYPALVPVDRLTQVPGKPYHTLINADNFHALQVLLYCYEGAVDVIYIDPPYNTGARDWKYNNDFVDTNDQYRHSKWLSMMKKRLDLARRLLKPDSGTLVVTIDEHEVHHLGALLEEVFPDLYRQMATIVINQKGVAQGRLSRAEEYAIFCFASGAEVVAQEDDLLSPDRAETKGLATPRWERLLRGGTNSRREDRHRLFFPIQVDPATHAIIDIGEPLPLGKVPNLDVKPARSVAWPVRTDGSFGNWRVSPPTLRKLLEKGFVKLGGFDESRKTWTVLYLGARARQQIEDGDVEIIGRNPVTKAVEVAYTSGQQRQIKTVWHRAAHDAGVYGSSLLRTILGEGASFAFPKSLYAVRDCLKILLANKPNATILDFFAGSGTTLHATALLNAEDGGTRRCVLVTNNEVGDTRGKQLLSDGKVPGSEDWEREGICESVTWPRVRYSTIERATTLYNVVYAPLYADLNPVLVHSRVANKRMVLDAIRSGRHRIIVCVDMFGEGFDLPNLKIAALHNVHKSLGVTLQFIGRFARSGSHVGEATFVANTAEDGVPEALESLYQEDSDWNLLLADLSYDAINPQAELSQLVENLEPASPTDETTDQAAPEISAIALKPKISGQVYRTSKFYPHRYADAFTAKQRIYHPKISRRDHLLILVVNQEDTLDWTDSRDIVTDSWDLYIGYFDASRNLLYLHSSRKGNATGALASAISKDPVLINGEETFKAFSGLKRLTLYSVGLSSRSKNVRYQLFAGLDVRNAIDPIQQQDKMKSNITGLGYENGKRRTVGCSRKGKIWSMSSGSIADWKSWCDEIGAKLCDPNAQPNDFLKYTLIPSVINELPRVPALMIDWPDQLFESSNFRFQVRSGDASHDFHDCQLDIVEWGARQSFTFVLSAGENLKTRLALEIEPQRDEHGERDSTYRVRYIGGDRVTIQAAGEGWEDVSFFEANPPLLRLADGSQISGNILLKPREELPDTFERSLIRTLDWTGVNFKKESRWKDGAFVDNSIQGRFIEHLAEGRAAFIIDDDDQGESADVVSIEETTDTVIVNLWHCKFAGGATPGTRADDLYVVCGQAEKSAKWTWSFENLVKHLLIRENEHRRGRPTRFIRGSAQELVTLRKSARRKFVEFRVGIVQPGFSKANAPPEHLAIIGGTNGFIRCITDEPLTVYASD